MVSLTPAQTREFLEEGFVLLPRLFAAAEVAEIAAAMDRLYALAEKVRDQPWDGNGVDHGGTRFVYDPTSRAVCHVAMAGNVEPVLLRYGRDPRLLAVAGELLGSPAMEWHINQVHFKRPGSGIAFDWHQDATYRGVGSGDFADLNGRGSYVQTLLAIDETTPESGPLQFVRGSGALGFLADVTPHLRPDRIATPLLHPGDVVLFGPFTIHGSGPNLSAQWRRVFINGFAYPHASRRQPRYPHQRELLTAPV